MKISIRGPIIPSNHQWIYDWLDMEATSPKKINDELEKVNHNEELEVEINSGGGSVFDASEIYTTLKDYKGNVTVKILGLAASAASVIAMAGDKILMSPTAQIMIHNASAVSEGDYRDMNHMSSMLKNTNRTIANAYKNKTGKEPGELLEMMDNETWLTADQALEHGMIDEIMFESNEGQLVASINNNMLPKKVINKIINEFKPKKSVSNEVSLNKKEEKTMTLDQFKNDNPDLYNEILNIGKTQGVNEERNRIKDIENIAIPGYENLINKAKFEEPKNAGQLSMEILKEQKNQSKDFLNNIEEDAEELEDIKASGGAEETNKVKDTSNLVSSMSKFLKNKNKGDE